MVCAGCGAANSKTTLLCKNCGMPLGERADQSTIDMMPGQAPGSESGAAASRPGADLPTAHMPGAVVRSVKFAPVSRLPFHADFPPETEQPAPARTLSHEYAAVLELSVLPASPQSPPTTYAPSSSGGMLPASRDIADLPTRTSIPAPVPPDPPTLPLVLPGMLSLPSQPKSGALFTFTPPEVLATPVALPGVGEFSPIPDQPDVAPRPHQIGTGRLPDRPPARPPGTQLPPVQPVRTELHRFAQPLPRRFVVGGTILAVLLLLGLVFVNPDWATGALVTGLVALTLALLLVIAAGVRVALGMLQPVNPQRRAQALSSALLILLLILVSVPALSQQSGIAFLQGRFLEGHQSWAAALAAYQESGERSSHAVDVARTYNEWGDAQMRAGQYAGAVTSFSMVIQHYQPVTSEYDHARNAIIPAYLAWADQDARQQNYAAATAHYDTLLALPFCQSACQQVAQPGDATAYYHLAEQLLAQQQYAQAVVAYQVLTNHFPRAPESSLVHVHYAQALLGEGQQQLSTACSDAVTTYRLLVAHFADTAQGKQAATALRQPVRVEGHFTQNVPGAPAQPAAYLVQGLTVGIQQYQFPPLLEHASGASIQRDGSFAFSSVPQGTYELVWSSDPLHFYYAFQGKQILYTARIGPLCTYNYGAIDQAIPAGTK